MPRSCIVVPPRWTIRGFNPSANARTPHVWIWRASPVIAVIAWRCRGLSPVDSASYVAAVLSSVDSVRTHVYHGGSCSHVKAAIAYYCRGLNPVAIASAVGSVYRGSCSPVIAVIACRCRMSSPVAAAAVPYVSAVPPHGLHPAGRTGTWVMCEPCRYCYRRGLSSYLGHVRPCVHPVATIFARDRWSTIVGYVVHPVATAIAMGYVATGVMVARVYTRSRLLSA